MDVQIAFFTESDFVGYVPRSNSGRTDTSWMAALNAYHCPFNRPLQGSFDIGIIIVPKKNPDLAFSFYERNKSNCTKWATMQEGPMDGWQDYSIVDQFQYLNLLNSVDIVFAHNDFDKRYYSGLLPHKKVSILQSLMLEDAIPTTIEKDAQKRTSCVIGGNFVKWYGGFDSYIVASEFEVPIYAPSMGRKQTGEEMIDGLTHLPYMNWSEWIERLSHFKYAVHLMRTAAAGTFQMNASFLGIPCISYSTIDTARICQPDLTVGVGDIGHARRLAQKLKTDNDFYDHCSKVANSNFLDNYSEMRFLERFREAIQ